MRVLSIVPARECVHTYPTGADLPDLAIEISDTWLTDFAWFTTGKAVEGCVLCELGCCMQRVFGDVLMTPGLVLHGVLGNA